MENALKLALDEMGWPRVLVYHYLHRVSADVRLVRYSQTAERHLRDLGYKSIRNPRSKTGTWWNRDGGAAHILTQEGVDVEEVSKTLQFNPWMMDESSPPMWHALKDYLTCIGHPIVTTLSDLRAGMPLLGFVSLYDQTTNKKGVMQLVKGLRYVHYDKFVNPLAEASGGLWSIGGKRVALWGYRMAGVEQKMDAAKAMMERAVRG